MGIFVCIIFKIIMSTYFLSLDLYLWNFDGKIRIKFMCNLEKWYAAAKSLQLCLTLCDPIDGSPPGSPVPGILQARTLEWVAISFSRGSSQPRSPGLQVDSLLSEQFPVSSCYCHYSKGVFVSPICL